MEKDKPQSGRTTRQINDLVERIVYRGCKRALWISCAWNILNQDTRLFTEAFEAWGYIVNHTKATSMLHIPALDAKVRYMSSEQVATSLTLFGIQRAAVDHSVSITPELQNLLDRNG